MYTFGGKSVYKIVHGADWGYANDATTVISSLVDINKKEIYIYNEIYLEHKKNKEIAQAIKDNGLEKARIIADSADPKTIAELKDLGIRNIKPVKKKKINGINFKISGIQMIQDYKIYVHPTCVHTIVELSNYCWDKDEFDRPINKPIDDFDHCLTGDTIVNTTDGDISIKNLVGKSGKLFGFNFDTMQKDELEFNNVRCTQKNAKVFRLELEDGNILRLTENHPVLTQHGWKEVRDLTHEDNLIKI